jgi:hypothetical protein
VKDAVKQLATAWNSSDLARLLSDQFTDRQRVLDTIFEVVPRDARLRILAVRGVRTLSQARRKEGLEGTALVSIVSALARLQIEYNDPTRGFQRLESNLDLILKITQIVEPTPPSTTGPKLVSGR